MKDVGFLDEEKEKDDISDLKNNISQLKKDKTQEIQIHINSVLELNRLGFTTDEEFHSDLNRISDKLNSCHNDQIIIRDDLIIHPESKQDSEENKEKEEEGEKKKENPESPSSLKKEALSDPPSSPDEENEIDGILKHLRVQLLS
mmetsp:Transcript_10029/g.9900  ORF Transcript_10029/g.9900 Transcript_10029/m.9900 type:complete len:145 (-) Transcript_10029:759-1193(-)